MKPICLFCREEVDGPEHDAEHCREEWFGLGLEEWADAYERDLALAHAIMAKYGADRA